jgi:hypothetical protein
VRFVPAHNTHPTIIARWINCDASCFSARNYVQVVRHLTFGDSQNWSKGPRHVEYVAIVLRVGFPLPRVFGLSVDANASGRCFEQQTFIEFN